MNISVHTSVYINRGLMGIGHGFIGMIVAGNSCDNGDVGTPPKQQPRGWNMGSNRRIGLTITVLVVFLALTLYILPLK